MREKKQEIREKVWRKLLEENVALPPFPVEGRIPNFRGAREAALKLRASSIYQKAQVVFSNPDSPQRHVRELVLRDGKILVMASPRLRNGFIVLDPQKIPSDKVGLASTIKGAFIFGEKVLERVPVIDLKVAGSVAVDIYGGRVGKGGGFSDLEYAILKALGAISEETPIVTTVHELQIVDSIPMDTHDVPMDYLFTPQRVVKTQRKYPRPEGIYWDKLSSRDIESIPVLKLLLQRRG